MTRNRRSSRLPGYDYASGGWYFITICTQKRECLFGEIVGVGRDRPQNEMRLDKYGEIVNWVWQSLPEHHMVQLDQFQIMPNHIHMIIVIQQRSAIPGGARRGVARYAPTGKMVSGSLSTIVRSFKSEVAKQIHKIDPNIRVWQRNYYEHIIRSEKELSAIRKYIQDNPVNWEKDNDNPKNVGLPTEM